MSTNPKEAFFQNFYKGQSVSLNEIIFAWNTICPCGDDSFKLYLQINMQHPSESQPFYIFEKKEQTILTGTENEEIRYGAKIKGNKCYSVSITNYSPSMLWLEFLMDHKDHIFKISEIEDMDFFVRIEI